MTTAKANHKAARALLLQYLDVHPGETVDADLDPVEAGIVGDTSHAEGGDSYHLGKDQIRTSGHRYSVDESARDKHGLDDYASAMDIGFFTVRTTRGTFTLRGYSVWLVGLCKAGDPDTADLREVIYSPDGKVVKRWDREGVRSTGDSSHLYHTHHSEYRDADGHRMIRLATRWLQHIGLIPEEDDVSEQDVINALEKFFSRDVTRDNAGATTNITSQIGRDAGDQFVPNPFAGKKTAAWILWQNIGQAVKGVMDTVAALAKRDDVDEAALGAALAPAVAAAVLAGLPDTTDPISPEEVTAAVKSAFAEAFGATPPAPAA